MIMSAVMNKKDAQLTKRIMRRIYVVWAIRTLLDPTLLKVLIVAVFFWRSTEHISYAHVIANAPRLTDISAELLFARSAIAHAEGVSLMLLSGIVIVSLWLVVDIVHRHKRINI